jgi:hypothetical protein
MRWVFFEWVCEILISRWRKRGLEGRERDVPGMKTTCGDFKSIAGKRASAEPREKKKKKKKKSEREKHAEVMKPLSVICGGATSGFNFRSLHCYGLIQH